MDEIVVVLITAPKGDAGPAIAKDLVEQRLAACVNLVPSVRSLYHWQGKLEDDEEVLLIVKTRKDLVDDLVAFVRRVHPYTVPEIIALPVIGGNSAYVEWVKEETVRKT